MIKCVIVDDEKPARDELQFLIEQSNVFKILDTFESGKKLLDSLSLKDAEVVFVDINMPGMTGIEVAEKLVGSHKYIVFVTAYDEYAIKAFELNAIDYLLKPISESRLIACLNRIEDEMTDDYDEKLEILLQQFNQKPVEKISIHYDGKILPIEVDQIFFIKAENKGVVLYTETGVYVTTHKLKDLEVKLFDTELFRCHRSYIINLKNIEHIEPWFNRTYNVSFKGIDEKVPISRHYVADFNKKMNIL